jgi:hypothetical protein
MTQNKNNLLFWFEIVWWVVTLVVIVGVLFPIWQVMEWPFQPTNVIFIAVFITFTRYIFLLQHTFLARKQLLKAILIIAMVPVTFYLVSQLNGFMVTVEEKTWTPLTGHLPEKTRLSMEAYCWNEMLFFGTGSVITAPLLAIRLLASIWLTHNRGTV